MECPQPERPELNYRSCEGHIPEPQRDIWSFGLAGPREQDLHRDVWQGKSLLVATLTLNLAGGMILDSHVILRTLKEEDKWENGQQLCYPC